MKDTPLVQPFILRYLDTPENIALAEKVRMYKRASSRHAAYFYQIMLIWEASAKTGTLYRLTENERRVQLSSGQAISTVAKKVILPFLVEVGQSRIQDLGTSFNKSL